MLAQREAELGQREAALGQREAAVGQREATLGQREAGLGQREAGLGQREAGLGQREVTLAQREAALVPSDVALNAFDKLRFQDVGASDADTVSTFLARFQSAAADLEPDERIKLEMLNASVELLKAVLADPHANKICALHWVYNGEGDVHSVIPLLLNNCPELASLQVEFKHHSAFDFVSSVLERPSNKVKVLEMPEYTRGNMPRFFAALGQSKVLALTISGFSSPKIYRGLCKYLAKDLLVRLKIDFNSQVSLETIMSLVNCTRLAELEMLQSAFPQPTTFSHLPKSITKLVIDNCVFVADFDWSFLTNSNVQELCFYDVGGVDGSQLGGALAVHLRSQGFDDLVFWSCDFIDETLAAVGMKLGQIKRLDFERPLNDASIKLIARVLKSSNSELKELRFPYDNDTASSIETHLVPALKHPNCNLAELSFFEDEPEYEAAAQAMGTTLRNRRALFALLQGQQVRRLHCPLRRLPVEMLRLVGGMLV